MTDPGDLSCPLPLTDHDTVQLAHGAGGRLSSELIARYLLPRFGNPELARLEDQAITRDRNAAYLEEGLRRIEGVSPIERDEWVTRWNFYFYHFKFI